MYLRPFTSLDRALVMYVVLVVVSGPVRGAEQHGILFAGDFDYATPGMEYETFTKKGAMRVAIVTFYSVSEPMAIHDMPARRYRAQYRVDCSSSLPVVVQSDYRADGTALAAAWTRYDAWVGQLLCQR